jgi:MFS family permease
MPTPVPTSQRRRPAVAWTAWTLCGLSVGSSIASVALAGLHGVSPAELLTTHTAVGTAAAASFPILGALIVVRLPRNWFGWVLLALGVFLGTFEFAQWYAQLALGPAAARPWLPGGPLASWLATWTNLPGITLASTLLLLLFPDGRVPSRRWRPLAWISAAVAVVPAAILAVQSWPLRGRALTGTLPPRLNAIWTTEFILALLLLVPCVAAVVVRFRRSAGIQRQQIKWFAYGGVVTLPLNAVAQMPGYGPVLELLQIPILVAAIAIAMFRFRLYDIDRILNRTLVYGLLSAILGGGYAVAVLLLGQAFSRGRHPSSLVVAATTLAAAALFQPLRRGIQRAVDRRFNRRRYDAVRTVAAFSTRLRQHVDLETLTTELLAVVQQTMEPTQASLWLRSAPARPQIH